MLKLKYSEIIIVGSGPSGYTSSLYILRSNFNIIIILGKRIGGQLINTNLIENWPAIKKVSGYDLMLNFYEQILDFNIELCNDNIYLVNFLNKPFIVITELKYYLCNIIILCTGSSYKLFDLKNQFKYIGKNISNCAVCDGFIYKNKKISIIGGGDTTFENIYYLINNYIYNIIIINRNKIFKSNYKLIKNVFNNFKNNIFIKFNFFLLEFIGDDFLLKYIKIKNYYNLLINIIYLDGLFLFIGNISNSKIFIGQMKIFKSILLTKKEINYSYTLTSINYIFSCGDVQDFLYKQALTSSCSGVYSYFDLLFYYKKIF